MEVYLLMMKSFKCTLKESLVSSSKMNDAKASHLVLGSAGLVPKLLL